MITPGHTSDEHRAVLNGDRLTCAACHPDFHSLSSEVNPGSDTITCLSCHTAHASDYSGMLRFDYGAMMAHQGGAASGTGCFACHTTKDVSVHHGQQLVDLTGCNRSAVPQVRASGQAPRTPCT